jgi:hypothetical protein
MLYCLLRFEWFETCSSYISGAEEMARKCRRIDQIHQKTSDFLRGGREEMRCTIQVLVSSHKNSPIKITFTPKIARGGCLKKCTPSLNNIQRDEIALLIKNISCDFNSGVIKMVDTGDKVAYTLSD